MHPQLPSGRPASDYACSDVDHLTDEQLRKLVRTAPALSEQSDAIGAECMRLPTPKTICKHAKDKYVNAKSPSEALMLELVFQQTTIPVPRVRRVLHFQYDSMIVMDYIPGRQLSHLWPEMETWEQLRVVFTLCSYVRQLRAIRHPRSAIPGPVAPPGHPARVCTSPLFGENYNQRGPFATSAELAAFFNQRYRRELTTSRRGIDAVAAEAQVRADPFDDTAPLVLSHQDINMRNIIVGDDGRLWLIDWEWSGFYPPWFEYVAMKIQTSIEECVWKRKEPLWDLLIPFICGPYYRQEKWRRRMAPALWYK